MMTVGYNNNNISGEEGLKSHIFKMILGTKMTLVHSKHVNNIASINGRLGEITSKQLDRQKI